MKDSPAVSVALAHIDAWGSHDWDKTRELLAPDVHASVTSTQRQFGGVEFAGVDNYMERKIKGAQLVEPGTVQVLSAVGDELNALITVTMRIRLGPDGTMVTLVRACAYMIDENKKIKDERDLFVIL
jgi:hypothetical protein